MIIIVFYLFRPQLPNETAQIPDVRVFFTEDSFNKYSSKTNQFKVLWAKNLTHNLQKIKQQQQTQQKPNLQTTQEQGNQHLELQIIETKQTKSELETKEIKSKKPTQPTQPTQQIQILQQQSFQSR